MQRREMLKLLSAALGYAAMQPLVAYAQAALPEVDPLLPTDPAVKARIQAKMKDFDQDFADDIYLPTERMGLLKKVQARMGRVQEAIGYAHFNLVSFDELLTTAVRSPRVGPFTRDELALIEETFFFDARNYGFYGEKVVEDLTTVICEKDVVKVAGTGHYVFRGRPEELYQEVIRDVGGDIVLTSGVRSVVKQFYLFYSKALACQGNLSRASRSLAPPGHSFHGVSDFDVGKRNWGARNFTNQFTESDVYKRLIDLGYVDLRYTETNGFGVRFEPWHIKVV